MKIFLVPFSVLFGDWTRTFLVFVVVLVSYCALKEDSPTTGTSTSSSTTSRSGDPQVGMTEEQVIPLCDNSYQQRGMTAVCKIGFGSGYFIMYDQGPGPGRRVVGVDLCALARNRGMCD